jgi:hypothetical protein
MVLLIVAVVSGVAVQTTTNFADLVPKSSPFTYSLYVSLSQFMTVNC